MSLELTDPAPRYLAAEPLSPFSYRSETCFTVVEDKEIYVEPGTATITGLVFSFATSLTDQADNPLLTEDS